MVQAGIARIDITPPAGLAMSGYAARTEPATGAHDPLTVRALAVDDTAIVVADVLGFHEDMAARIRARCVLPDERVVVVALHNHGGPDSMAARAGDPDPAYLRRLEHAAVEAIDRAVAARRPARLGVGLGDDPDVTRNRRRPDGPVDRALPVLRVVGEDGAPIAVMAAYACHPVVLSADNRLWTADYAHYVRTALEARHPGAMALFFSGCAGDLNNGHSPQASMTLAVDGARSFATAERLGNRIAEAAFAAPETPVAGDIGVANARLPLGFERLERTPLPQLAAEWRAERAASDAVRAALLDHWIRWAETAPPPPFPPWWARITVLRWGDVPIIALPGEIFAETALTIRAALGGRPAFVIGYAEGNPGYIPPAREFPFGGYEVEEAHRFYGMPATFAAGSAEELAAIAIRLLRGE
jgi:hypothetical protein